MACQKLYTYVVICSNHLMVSSSTVDTNILKIHIEKCRQAGIFQYEFLKCWYRLNADNALHGLPYLMSLKRHISNIFYMHADFCPHPAR